MTKKYMVLYNEDKETLSLKSLALMPNCFLEDIFYCVADSNDFTELTKALSNTLNEKIYISAIHKRFIRYIIHRDNEILYLKISVKENVNG